MTDESNVRGIADMDETDRLISSRKVEGTAVFDRAGDRLGAIDSFMVDKRTGKVEYAILSFGGFIGIGEDHYPVPWDMLTYDTDQGGYVTDITHLHLANAPRYGRGEEPAFDRDYGTQVYGAYGMIYPNH